ncbi:MAG: hypothetical protein JNL09_09870, partial [Anaerolineales bacterium]|nr:hypothetical protein [Anaerolineales bacterium]
MPNFIPSLEVKELLDPDAIMQQEFEYARETALQANNDRTLIVNLYVILVGGVGSLALGLPALAPEGSALSNLLLGAIFLLMGILGLFNVLKLIRLRQAWHDSAKAMNQIKDFYMAHYPGIAPAFRWRTETIPPPGKMGTITFDLVVLVAVIDSLAVGGGLFFLSLPLWAATLAALVFFGVQWALYFRLLK